MAKKGSGGAGGKKAQRNVKNANFTKKEIMDLKDKVNQKRYEKGLED